MMLFLRFWLRCSHLFLFPCVLWTYDGFVVAVCQFPLADLPRRRKNTAYVQRNILDQVPFVVGLFWYRDGRCSWYGDVGIVVVVWRFGSLWYEAVGLMTEIWIFSRSGVIWTTISDQIA